MIEGAEQTQRQALVRVAKYKKVDPEVLFKIPKLRPQLQYLISYFYEIKLIGDVNFQSMEAWQNIYNIRLNPFELKAILRLNYLFKCQK